VEREHNEGLKMIVGLGNPGAKYNGTRHNVGFEVLDSLQKKWMASSPRSKFEGQFATATMDGVNTILVWPLTYMNDSGRCVLAMANFYKVDSQRDLLVVCDDLSLPLGKLRMRASGSAGGQKGLNDILRVFGSQSVARLRIGIDPAPPQWDVADYVLGRFREDQRPVVTQAIVDATDAVSLWAKRGIEFCMNRIN
jgi:peptidyl-tRNA hydrolase, PTH1 family